MKKKLLTFVLVFLAIFGIVGVAKTNKVHAVSAGTKLYLTPNSNWKQANARFAAYFFGSGEGWASMEKTSQDNLYWVSVPDEKFTKVIFCRMNPSETENNWDNKWNQTNDLVIPTNGDNKYTIAEGTWDENGGIPGSWSKVPTVTFWNSYPDDDGTYAAKFDPMFSGGTFVVPADPVMDGYKFLGWNNGKAERQTFKAGDTVTFTGDEAYYAQWEAIKKEYVITFVINGNEINKRVLEDVMPEAPTLDGYTIIGWDKEIVAATADVTYTAKFVKHTDMGAKIAFTYDFDAENYIYISAKGFGSTVYAHLWNENDTTTWPGEKMTFVETNSYGEKVYKINPGDAEYVIFNDGTNQTVNITINYGEGNHFYLTDKKDVEGHYEVGRSINTTELKVSLSALDLYFVANDIEGILSSETISGFKYQVVRGEKKAETAVFAAENNAAIKLDVLGHETKVVTVNLIAVIDGIDYVVGSKEYSACGVASAYLGITDNEAINANKMALQYISLLK